MAQEAKDPQRGMPIGMLGSLGICTVLYILMSSVMTGLVPFKQLERRGAGRGRPRVASAAALAVELGHLGRAVRTDLGDHHDDHPAGAHLADAWRTTACCRSSSARFIRKFRTPHISTLITGVAAATFAGLLPIGILGELVSIGTLIAFIVVCLGVLVLRYTRPDLPRPFRVKWVWFTALMGVMFCAGMAASLPDGDLAAAGAVERRSASRSTSSTATAQPAAFAPSDRPRRGGGAPAALAAQRLRRQRTDRLEQPLVHLRVAGDDVRPEGVLGAGRRADASARFLDQQRARRGVPGR